ncbi:ribosomal protein L7/L12 [Babesia divergens]|uniref:Ribosomal protein L7/L12 n=1 Tax=Babesia divergens TaxID=32595 RepID=A0AAD9GAI1_BABDI|nr:ribosomal protein L7/L12 [Babesia divergens]
MRLHASLSQVALRAPVSVRIRRFSTPAYDIFKKIKDSNDADAESSDDGRRKPSDRVIKLVDEILNLTLIESADLCDLCQQRLAGPRFNNGFMPGRTPFPHPQFLFSGANMMPMGGMPASTPGPEGQPSAPPTPPAEAAPAAKASQPKQPGTLLNCTSCIPATAKKTTGSVTLVGFDASKKIAVIKVVRTVTGLGLRECKELVESLPRVVKKDMPIEDAEKIAKEIEAAGGTITMD